MFSFECDYLEGCHEKVLEALIKNNRVQQPGYGEDSFSADAKAKIKEACQAPDADVYFINGGTQTNQLVIDTMLAPYEGAISADTGHINVHEAGAVEFTGHKVLALPSHDGKLDAAEVKAFIEKFYGDGSHDHMVFPGIVYISHPTEYGTLYTADELRALSAVCHEKEIPLFIDGARLGYGLMAHGTDVTLPMIAELADVFYIGGTKVGALCGEAVVFTHNNTPKHFVTRIKQHGAMSAKGRLMGIQFDTLFTDNLYFEISKHALDMADRMKQIFTDLGYKFYIDSPTNQQFFIVENEKLAKIGEKVGYSFWEAYDETHTVVRFATSWSTTEAYVDELEKILKEIG